MTKAEMEKNIGVDLTGEEYSRFLAAISDSGKTADDWLSDWQERDGFFKLVNHRCARLERMSLALEEARSRVEAEAAYGEYRLSVGGEGVSDPILGKEDAASLYHLCAKKAAAAWHVLTDFERKHPEWDLNWGEALLYGQNRG